MSGMYWPYASRRTLTASILVFGMSVSGCAGTMTKEEARNAGQLLGLAAGLVAGAVLGEHVGGSVAVLVGAAAGGAIGTLAGEAIATRLAPGDEELADGATKRALDSSAESTSSGGQDTKSSGGSATVTSPTSGFTTAWSSTRNPSIKGASTATAAESEGHNGICRWINQVAWINGEEIRSKQKYCRGQGESRWDKVG